MTSKIQECIDRYGKVQASPEGGLIWREATSWIKPLPIPDKIVLRNIYGKPVYRIFANVDIHAPLTKAFARLIECGAHTELNTFDGCFHVRFVRGVPGSISFHSFGIALDFNAKTNPLGGKGTWSDKFISCMKDSGFIYGGDFSKRPDPMHWELKEIPK